MTRIFFWDVESIGLLIKKGPGFNNFYPYTNLEKYNVCRLVSIGYKVCTTDGDTLTTKYFVVKPRDFIIDDDSEATKINGITGEIASKGVDIDEVFKSLESDLNDVKLLVAHNVLFDKSIVCSELYRYNNLDLCQRFASIPTYCTCLMGNDITKIKPRGWKSYKVPKLSELYEFLFNEKFDNAHNAEADVNACARCYFKMIHI